MSDTVKLIIEIPKTPKNDHERWVLAHGIPLEDLKTEIKAMFPPSGNWMYDEECEHEHTVCEVLADVLKILDSIGKGDSE